MENPTTEKLQEATNNGNTFPIEVLMEWKKKKYKK
jgi:hypothetical protein